MAKERQSQGSSPDTVISIIGPGMKVVGDCTSDGTIRVEGTVEGSIKAGKAVVIGKNGFVHGDVVTQDAVLSGRFKGALTAESRLELQATCQVDGEVVARRMQLEEGAILNGTVQMGDKPRTGAQPHEARPPAKEPQVQRQLSEEVLAQKPDEPKAPDGKD